MNADIALFVAKGFTGGDRDHFFDKIKAGDHFGYRMFDLKAGIHFQKIEIAITINDKFDRTGTVIANRRGKPNRFGTHCLTGGIIQKRRWCFFDDFLVAALDRTFALIQMDAIAGFIGQNLNFDMAWAGDEFFDKHTIITKAGCGFTHGGGIALSHFTR